MTAIKHLYLRTIDERLAEALTWAFASVREVTVDHAHIWNGPPADIVVSPANSTGRMDGGLDQIIIDRFGWQLEHRLMRDIRVHYQGCLPVGQAHLITTYDKEIPLMICAPTMSWPPGDVSGTSNALLSFSAALRCAATVGAQALARPPVVLASGMGTGIGRIEAQDAALQMRQAWETYGSFL